MQSLFSAERTRTRRELITAMQSLDAARRALLRAERDGQVERAAELHRDIVDLDADITERRFGAMDDGSVAGQVRRASPAQERTSFTALSANWHTPEAFGTAAILSGYRGTFPVPMGRPAYVLLTHFRRQRSATLATQQRLIRWMAQDQHSTGKARPRLLPPEQAQQA